METFPKLSFDKKFFARLLGTNAKKLRYAFLVQKTEEQPLYRPVLTVKNIKHFVFDIDTGKFKPLSENDTIEKARVSISKNDVTFSNPNADRKIRLVDFYRHYMDRIVNDLLY